MADWALNQGKSALSLSLSLFLSLSFSVFGCCFAILPAPDPRYRFLEKEKHRSKKIFLFLQRVKFPVSQNPCLSPHTQSLWYILNWLWITIAPQTTAAAASRRSMIHRDAAAAVELEWRCRLYENSVPFFQGSSPPSLPIFLINFPRNSCVDWRVHWLARGTRLVTFCSPLFNPPPPLEDPKAAMNTKDGTPVKNSPAAKGPPTTPLAVNNTAGAAAAALAQGSPAVNSLERELLERQGPGPLMDRPISATEKATANANEQRDKMDAFAKRSAAKRRQRQSSNSQLNVAKQHQEMEVLPLLKGRQKSANKIFLFEFSVSFFDNLNVLRCFLKFRHGPEWAGRVAGEEAFHLLVSVWLYGCHGGRKEQGDETVNSAASALLSFAIEYLIHNYQSKEGCEWWFEFYTTEKSTKFYFPLLLINQSMDGGWVKPFIPMLIIQSINQSKATMILQSHGTEFFFCFIQ